MSTPMQGMSSHITLSFPKPTLDLDEETPQINSTSEKTNEIAPILITSSQSMPSPESPQNDRHAKRPFSQKEKESKIIDANKTWSKTRRIKTRTSNNI